MKISFLISRLILTLAILIFAASCTSSPTPSSSTSSVNTSTPTIRFGFSSWPGFAPWQVTEDIEIFDDRHLNVDIKFYDYVSSVKAFANGELDTNLQTLMDTIISMAAGSKTQPVIVLSTDTSEGADSLIVRRGIDKIADLKGKKIALEAGYIEHFLLLIGLKKAGLKPKDVQIQNLDMRAAVAAFVEEQVDAVGIYVPYPPEALKRPGSKVLFSSKDFPGVFTEHLVVDRKLIDTRPEDVQALVDTWFDTLDFIRKNPDKSDKPMADSMGVTVEEFKKYKSQVKIMTIEENLKAFSPRNDAKSLSYNAKNISQFLLENGVIKKQPDISKMFDDRFVKARALSQSS